MLACKGIFATPSIDTAVKRPPKAERLLGILYNKIPYVSIILHFKNFFKTKIVQIKKGRKCPFSQKISSYIHRYFLLQTRILWFLIRCLKQNY